MRVKTRLTGLAFGALIGAALVWVNLTFLKQSDEDLLVRSVTDLCLPFVGSGTPPNADIVTPVAKTALVATPARMVEDAEGAGTFARGRFEIVWGRVPGLTDGKDTVFCQIAPVATDPTVAGFAIENQGFIARMTAALADHALLPDVADLQPAPPSVVTWIDKITLPAVTMIIGEGLVPLVLVTRQPG